MHRLIFSPFSHSYQGLNRGKRIKIIWFKYKQMAKVHRTGGICLRTQTSRQGPGMYYQSVQIRLSFGDRHRLALGDMTVYMFACRS